MYLVVSPGAPAALRGRGLDQIRHRSSMDCVYLTLVMLLGGGILLSPNTTTEDQCKHVLSGSVPPARRESVRARCSTGQGTGRAGCVRWEGGDGPGRRGEGEDGRGVCVCV